MTTPRTGRSGSPCDLVVPVAAYYLLRLLGSSVYAALLVSTG